METDGNRYSMNVCYEVMRTSDLPAESVSYNQSALKQET